MYERKTIENPVKNLQGQLGKLPSINVNFDDGVQVFTKKEQKFINRIRKWGIVIAVISVVGYATYRFFFG